MECLGSSFFANDSLHDGKVYNEISTLIPKKLERHAIPKSISAYSISKSEEISIHFEHYKWIFIELFMFCTFMICLKKFFQIDVWESNKEITTWRLDPIICEGVNVETISFNISFRSYPPPRRYISAPPRIQCQGSVTFLSIITRFLNNRLCWFIYNLNWHGRYLFLCNE